MSSIIDRIKADHAADRAAHLTGDTVSASTWPECSVCHHESENTNTNKCGVVICCACYAAAPERLQDAFWSGATPFES